MKRKIVKLGDVCEIKSGGTPSRSKQEYWKDGNIPWIKIGDINSKNVSSSSEFITDLGLNNSSTKLFKKGTVLYTIFATLGEVGILDIDATTNQAIAGILPSDELDKNYLYYFLKSKKDFVNKIGRGVAQNNINLSILRDFEIDLLPIDQQIKIANILDQAQELIDKRKEQIATLDKLIQSVFYDMFGDAMNSKWSKCTLTQIVKDEKHSIKRGPFGGALKKEIFVNEGYLIYEQYHAINEDFSMARYFIDDKKYNELIAFKVLPGDLIISCSGTLGKIAELPKNARMGIINQALLKLSLDSSKMNNTYFKYLFRTEKIQDILFGVSRGSGISNFPPMSVIKEIGFITPPIELQNQFAEIVESIERQKALLNEGLIELENNFNSLMQRAFKGESLY